MSRQPFVRRVPSFTWYFANPRFRAYMMREATCLLVALYCALLLAALAAIASGERANWENFLAGQQSWGWVLFHSCSLLFFCAFQTFPWFRLAPKAMPLSLGEIKIPARGIVLAHYVGWVTISALVLWLVRVF